jgi:hypothetical protein
VKPKVGDSLSTLRQNLLIENWVISGEAAVAIK